jgi:hypothetical protein
MLDDAYSANKIITGSFILDDLISMIAKNIQKFNHRPYHVPPSIKEYLRVRDKQHGKDPNPPHPIKKRKHRDMYKALHDTLDKTHLTFPPIHPNTTPTLDSI